MAGPASPNSKASESKEKGRDGFFFFRSIAVHSRSPRGGKTGARILGLRRRWGPAARALTGRVQKLERKPGGKNAIHSTDGFES